MLGLSDLDELILTIRDQTSKLYMKEAILSFRSGAYRASIVSTWIAVAFDIISKIKELAEQGDKEAQVEVTNLELYIKNKQIVKLQEFENSLLKKAESDYKFLTSSELKDLDRLKEDRNLCAHPAMSDTSSLYQPTAELVKMHIVHAILHLLQHQPVQGKTAIKRIFDDIKKASFPSDFENTKIWLDTKYLNRAKPILIKNLIQALLKGLLNGDVAKDGKMLQVLNTLRVVAFHNQQFFIQERNEVLKKLANTFSEDQLWYLIELLTIDSSVWTSLSDDVRIRIKVFLQSESKKMSIILNKYTIVSALGIPDLKDVIESIKISISNEIENKIAIYGNAGSYATAKELGETIILPYISYFNATNTKKIIEAIMHNKSNQILDAFGSEPIVEAIFDGTIGFISQTIEDWKKLVNKITDENDHVKLKNKVKIAEQQIHILI